MKVVNRRLEKETVYIGRGSVFGNPFVLSNTCSREQSIAEYANYVSEEAQLSVLRAIYALPKDAVLGCYCKPLACHGDVIIAIWEALHSLTKEELDAKRVLGIASIISRGYNEALA